MTRPHAKLSSRRWLTVGVLALVFALLLGGIYSLLDLPRVTSWSRHTDQVRLSLAAVEQSLGDAEASMRGYLISRDRGFLASYERHRDEIPERFDDVRAMTIDSPTQQHRLAELGQMIHDQLAQLAAVTELRRPRDVERAVVAERQTMDVVRGVLDQMRREEETLDAGRQEEATGRWRSTVLLLVSAIVAFLIVVGVVWMNRREQMSERRQREELARSQALFEIVLAGTDMGITVQSPDGRLIYANERASTILGYPTPAALIAATSSEILARFEMFRADGTPLSPSELPSRHALAGELSEEVPVRFRLRAGGEERWSQMRSVPARDGAGNVLYAINFFREVTAEHHEAARRGFLLRAADELNSSLDYERTLASVAALAVPTLADWCAVDLVDGDAIKRVATAHVDPARISAVVELHRRYPGTGAAEMIRSGKPHLVAEVSRAMLAAAAKDDEHLRLLEELQLGSYMGLPLVLRGEVAGAMTFAMAESGRRYTEADLQFARALADRAAIAIENARLFEGEKQRREQAEETSRFAETFIGILGHDLRNPLNAIAMAAGLLRRQNSDSKVIGRIESSAQRMASMVDQLLDLTRSRLAGGIAIEPQPTDLGAIVGAAIDELALVYRGRTIMWTRRSLHGNWDHDRLAQVVSNLLGNALEHGDPERPVEVELGEHGDDEAILVVRNQGPPIAPELLPVLFEPYRRGLPRRAGTRGLGLGLFISDKIVQAHGGHIEVRSSAEAGTELRVTLPGRIPPIARREVAR